MSSLPFFTIFDVETTGLDPNRGHKIIELAGVRIENGEICDDTVFDELVNPERLIPPEAQQVNKIRDEEVANAPTIDMVLPKFLEFAENSVLVAHNATFDMGFLTREKECCWGYVDLPEILCTMRLSKAVFPTEFRHNLDALGMRLNLHRPQNRHRALPDVLLTAEAFLEMLNRAKISSMEELRQKAGTMKMAA